MIRRHPSRPRTAPVVVAVATAVLSSYIPASVLEAQTPPPARPPRPVVAPRAPTPTTPRTPPTPAVAPTPRVWVDGMFDRAFPDIDMARLDAVGAMAAARADMALSRVDFVDMNARLAEAQVAMAHASTNWTPLAPLPPMEPLPAMTLWSSDAPPAAYAPGFAYGFTTATSERRTPPASWNSEDPADSLYREARKALSSDSYRKAAELFRRIRDQYPKSTYTPDAPYWEAFALQRLGNETDLRAAKDALEWQLRQHPRATTTGEAKVLATRIDGALARRGDTESYNSLVGSVNKATSQGCPRDDEDERVAALNALARMDTAQVVPVLKKVLARREACTQALRRTAVWLYASRRVADAPAVLMNVARTDPDREVREQAVFWMANVPTDEAVNMLIDLAKSGNDLDLRKRAVYSLSRSKSTRAAGTLREIATDAGAPSELRRDALQWYMSGPGKTDANAMGFLKEVYGRADEQNFRNGVLSVIASRKNDDARQFLSEIVGNTRESIETRRHALSALYSSGTNVTQLTSIYDRSPEYEIKRSVIGVLASARENAGVDKLIDIARNEKDARLKSQAVSMLSRTKDPRAMALLQEIILK